MEEIFSELFGIILSFIRGALLAWFLSDFLHPRFNEGFFTKNAIAFSWGFFLIIPGELSPGEPNSIKIIIKQVFCLIALLLLIYALYNADIRLIVYLGVTAMSAFNICLVFSSETSEIFSHINEKMSDDVAVGSLSIDDFMKYIHIGTYIEVIFSIVLTIMLYTIVLKIIKKAYTEKQHRLNNTELIFLVLPALGGWITALMFRSTLLTLDKNGYPISLYDSYPVMLVLEPVILLLMLFGMISALFLFQGLIKSTREASAKQLLEREIESLRLTIDESMRLNRDILGLKHDMKNNLSVIAGLIDGVSADESDSLSYRRLYDYVHTLLNEDAFSTKGVSTGDAVTDALISMKLNEAKEKIPEIKTDIDECIFTKDDSLLSYDICAILGNALDNAIRACALSDAPWIKISTTHRGSFIIIEVKNSCTNIIKEDPVTKLPISDRKDSSLHGFGFINMEKAVNKHNGAIDYEINNGIFTLTAMLQKSPV